MQSSDYNLDPFIDGESFDAGKLDIADNTLNEFFELLPIIVLEKGDKYFLQLINENEEYVNCKDFFAWLYGYAQTISDIYQKTEKIRELAFEEFEQLFDYCLEKLILHDIGLEEAANNAKGQKLYHEDNINLMAGLINTYYTKIFKGASKHYADRHMRRASGISEDKCEIFWERYLKYEDDLWKIYSMRLQNEINDKLDLFIKTISEIEEEE